MSLLSFSSSVLIRHFIPAIKFCVASVHAESVLDFGPAFLPDTEGLKPQRWNSAEERHSAGLAVSCFGLSLNDRAKFGILLTSMHASAPYALFADFKTAERNIEIPACLLMTPFRFSSGNKGCFTEYEGLEGLLYEERARFQVLERFPLLGGGLLCALCRCLPA